MRMIRFLKMLKNGGIAQRWIGVFKEAKVDIINILKPYMKIIDFAILINKDSDVP